ncbi:PREDICTED: spermatogenesis-associated protein 3 [Chrysochloris asiatica]|uniref:Spermatogenesis-associated protein 3 n=1 Tax=Chrysochloris asiatica TaxID=185453 RepID=A0A9B0TN05_CHRAS|nr:PREDICTED: spermatogenesis-associated protein 3 [Chrysochloris asiatica]
MRKGKRKRPGARRRDSASHNSSLESTTPTSTTPTNPSYNSAPQSPSSTPIPLHPSSDTNSQPLSSESSPQNSALPALPAPEISQPTQCLLPLDMKAAFPSENPGPLTPVGPHSCACVPCPGSSACCRHLGQCHSRICDTLMPRDWHPLPGRGIPSLLTFYRRSGRKHSFYRSARAPGSRDRCCGSGNPGSCFLHH